MEADEGNLSLKRIDEGATDFGTEEDLESNKSHNAPDNEGRGLKKFKWIFTKRGQLEKERMGKELRGKTRT